MSEPNNDYDLDELPSQKGKPIQRKRPPFTKTPFFRPLAIAVFCLMMVMVEGTSLYKTSLGVTALIAIQGALFGGVIMVNIVLYLVGLDPEGYRKVFGIPIARVAHYQKGGRPRGSIKTSGKLPPSIYAEETQAFIRDAKRTLEEKSYKEFLECCDAIGEKESTVRGWIKRYGDKV
ncbi:MAG TPA: hypothetical protein PK530_20045 [Anaerolineales bacterium]|nr:hypothetical protein [Anaerolineales bacterium]